MPHSSINKPLFTNKGLVKKDGGAGNLAKGQLAFILDKVSLNNQGAKVVSDFAGLKGSERIAIRVGRNKLPNNLRDNHAPYYQTDYFPLNSITKIEAKAPVKTTLKTDKFLIGYDGINPGSALFIPEGKSALLDIAIYGFPVEMDFGDDESEMEEETFVIRQRAYRAKNETMQEVIQKLVADLKQYTAPRSRKTLDEYLDIKVVDSTNVDLTGTPWVISTLSIADDGTSNAQALVKAQYAQYNVVVTDRLDGVTTYGILHLASETLDDYVAKKSTVKLKGCADCVAGYDEVAGGVVYTVSLEDDGDDKTGVVGGLPGAVAGTAIKFGNKDGKGTYSVVLDNALTDVELKAFTDANVTAEVKKLGFVEDVCEKIEEETFTWVDGDTCYAQTKKFTIQLQDSECGDRLAELQAFYPNLVITIAQGGTPAAPITGGCQTVYETTVPTNIVCNECSCIFLQPFYAESPGEYDGYYWTAEPTVYDPDAKMGILIEGKEFKIQPDDYAVDFIPYVETSTKIRSASFGVREMDYLNFTPAYDVTTEFAKVRQLSKSEDVMNSSQYLFGFEEMSRAHYLGETKHTKNLFARTNLGEESLLTFGKRMITYHISYQDTRLSQFAGGRSGITHEIPIVVEEGYHQEIEEIVNKLAAKVGLDTVNPTAN